MHKWLTWKESESSAVAPHMCAAAMLHARGWSMAQVSEKGVNKLTRRGAAGVEERQLVVRCWMQALSLSAGA